MSQSRNHILIKIKKVISGIFPSAYSHTDFKIIAESTITCPYCGFKQKERMPSDSCVIFYVCLNCRKVMRAAEGDCCVFCTYGDIKCPGKQRELL
jgi:hypothetical protein